MKQIIMIFLSILFISLSLIFYIQCSYDPRKKVQYKNSPTDFIEPPKDFINCYEDTDCIKVKGSACPPSQGGIEVCVNKNYFQEYISEIDKQAGPEGEVVCPQVFLVSNKTCGCIGGTCILA